MPELIFLSAISQFLFVLLHSFERTFKRVEASVSILIQWIQILLLMILNVSWLVEMEVRQDCRWEFSFIPLAIFSVHLFFTHVAIGYLRSKPPLSQTVMDNANRLTFEMLIVTSGLGDSCSLAAIFFSDLGHVASSIFRNQS